MDGRRKRFESVPGLVLILVPTEDLDADHVIPAARVAALHAIEKKLHPINPILYFGSIFQFEDITRQAFLPRIAWWWERCSRIWLCAHDGRSDLDDLPLDSVTHSILMRNEHVRVRGGADLLKRHHKDPVRKTVNVLSWGSGDEMHLNVLSRTELDYILQVNVVTGLLRGVI